MSSSSINSLLYTTFNQTKKNKNDIEKIVDLINSGNISGNNETLSKIESISDRLVAQPGSCVKNNQRLYVGSVCPKIAVTEMKVS